MATFAEIQSSVSKRLLDPDAVAVSAADVATSINDSIEYWKFHRFWFNEVFDDVLIPMQDKVIPMTGDILFPSIQQDGFSIEYSGIRYPLRKVSQEIYDSMFLTNGYGMPQYYARVGQEYQVYPIPDREYTVKRHYLKEYADLVDGTDTNDFTDYASRLITLWSCADLIAEFRQDEAMEGYFRNRADKEKQNLMYRTGRENATGRSTTYSNLL